MDTSGFEETALPHRTDLFRAACAILGNREAAEDVVQETYLEAWKSFHRFRQGTNCRAWLFRILFHVISHQRRKWRETAPLEETDAVYQEAVPERLTDEDVLAAFRKLPAPYAEVVLLADVEEFSYREIQETLGIAPGTVMSRLHRGRGLLRAELANLGRTRRVAG